MATLTPGYPKQPELNLLRANEVTERGTLRSLLGNIRDLLFPPKEAPLHLTSKPVKVRDIWGEYNYKKKGATYSTFAHVAMIGSLIAVSIIGARQHKVFEQPKQQVTDLVLPADLVMPITPKKNDSLAGGGGGGDRDKLQAPKGKLPKFAMEQITPPAMVIRNDHPKLAVEPTVVMPPQ